MPYSAYWLPVTVLTDDRKVRLKNGGVVFTTCRRPGAPARSEERGLLFSEQSWQSAAALLGARVIATTRLTDAIALPTVAFDQPQGCLVLASRADRKNLAALISSIQNRLLPIVQRDVQVRNGNRRCWKPQDHDTDRSTPFQFVVAATTNANVATRKSPETLLGVELGGHIPKLLVPGNSGFVLTGPRGEQLAEVTRDYAVLTFNPSLLATGKEQLSDRVVADIALYLRSGEFALYEAQRQRAAANESAVRLAFVKKCQTWGTQGGTTATQERHALEDSIREATANLIRLVQQRNALVRQAANPNRLEAFEENTLHRQITEIQMSPRVTEVLVLGDYLYVYTDTLYCFNPDTDQYHEIGRMRIVVNLSGTGEWLRIYNLTRRGHSAGWGVHHPHIDSDGRLCLGTFEPHYAELFAAHRFAGIVWFAIQFVESVTPQDPAGRSITLWPIVPPDRVAELRAAGRIGQRPFFVPPAGGTGHGN